MKKALVAKKVGMTQIFGEKGALIPVTVLEATPNVVVQKKTNENEGYEALQIGVGSIRAKHVTKPLKGHFDKADVEPKKLLKELKFENASEYEIGQEIKADIFTAGDKVDVSGISKGKGYQGSIKRHGMHRGPMSHGSKYHRGTGAMACSSTPGKVRKGKRLPGHMGSEKVTVQNLTVVRADAEKNLLLIKGAIPGSNGSMVFIKETVKTK
jgi:large subunit ribosomal protein L3